MIGLLKSRAAIAVGALVVGAVGAGAVTYAIADGPADTFYACKTSTGKIRAGTIRTGTAPTCRPDRGETVASWSGANGAGSIDDLVGAPCRIGDPAEGTFEVAYEPGTGNATFRCPPNDQVQLTVTRSGPGAEWGHVGGTSIDCGSVCVYSYQYGTTIHLSASGGDAQPDLWTTSFSGWDGDCLGIEQSCTLLMTSDRSVTATFDYLAPVTLTVSKTGAGAQYGTVTGQGYDDHAHVKLPRPAH